MIDVHFLEFALSGKLSPDQIKDVISAVKLKNIVEKKRDDETEHFRMMYQKLLKESEKDL